MAPKEIIQKSRELADLIDSHSASLRYRELRQKLQKDRDSQELLVELVQLGDDLNRAMQTSEDTQEGPAERDFLRQKLEDNSLVKEFILAQKEYLTLYQKVLQAIQNPENEPQ